MRVLFTVIFAALFILPAVGLSQNIVYVDDDNLSGPWLGTQVYPFKKIQDGIDYAIGGETVLVLPGYYVENINFLGKAITVKSDGGPEKTTIDGCRPLNPDRRSVVVFENGEGADSVIEGFKILNGSGSFLQEYGAYCGGGILCYFSSPTISNNVITGNRADKKGGGICCECASPTITNNLILKNSAGSGGGGIHCKLYSPKIEGNTIVGNLGIYGGGIYCSSATPEIANNILYRNIALFGGGIACYEASPALRANTICANYAADKGGGMFLRVYSYPIVSNTILWNNRALLGSEISLIFSSEISISYSDVCGGMGSIYYESGSTFTIGAGMIDEDPLFADPRKIDFHLSRLSPCVDGGDPNSEMMKGSTRSDGIQDQGIVDMGYHYEVSRCTLEWGNDLGPRGPKGRGRGKH